MINLKFGSSLIFGFIAFFMVIYPPHALIVAFMYLLWLYIDDGEKLIHVRRVENKDELCRINALFDKYGDTK